MDDLRKSELETKLRHALKEHQHEGLNMIGNAEQLLHRLVDAVEEWTEGGFISQKKAPNHVRKGLHCGRRPRRGRPIDPARRNGAARSAGCADDDLGPRKYLVSARPQHR